MSVATFPQLKMTTVARSLDGIEIGPRDGAGRLVVVAMSGGVDSAVTALIMRERGYRVVGMNLRLFSPKDPDHSANPCCGIPAMDDARATCALMIVGDVRRHISKRAPGKCSNVDADFHRHSAA